MSTDEGLFDSAWLKWGRAVVHSQALQTDIERFALDPGNKPFGSITAKYHPKRHGFAVAVSHVEPIPARWNLMLGDAANNFRACLDHLAWAFVRRGKSPNLTNAQAQAVYFPITDSRTHFNKVVASKLPGVRRTDLALVRQVQPYTRGKTRAQWTFPSVLNRIVNDDKHRQIQGLWMGNHRFSLEVTQARDCVATGFVPRQRQCLIEVGTELGFVHARKDGPNPHIDVKYGLTTYPAFNQSLWLDYWLDVTAVQLAMILSELAQAPQSIESLGIDDARWKTAEDNWRTNALLTNGRWGNRLRY